MNYNGLEIMGICFIILITLAFLFLAVVGAYLLYIHNSAKIKQKFNISNIHELVKEGKVDITFQKKDEKGNNIGEEQKITDLQKSVDKLVNVDNKEEKKDDRL